MPPTDPAAPPPNRATRRHPNKVKQQIQPGYVSIVDAAIYLDVAPKTVRRMINRGDLRAYRLGSRVLKLKVSDLDNVLTPR